MLLKMRNVAIKSLQPKFQEENNYFKRKVIREVRIYCFLTRELVLRGKCKSKGRNGFFLPTKEKRVSFNTHNVIKFSHVSLILTRLIETFHTYYSHPKQFPTLDTARLLWNPTSVCTFNARPWGSRFPWQRHVLVMWKTSNCRYVSYVWSYRWGLSLSNSSSELKRRFVLQPLVTHAVFRTERSGV